jgi:hypothetical protein
VIGFNLVMDEDPLVFRRAARPGGGPADLVAALDEMEALVADFDELVSGITHGLSAVEQRSEEGPCPRFDPQGYDNGRAMDPEGYALEVLGHWHMLRTRVELLSKMTKLVDGRFAEWSGFQLTVVDP